MFSRFVHPEKHSAGITEILQFSSTFFSCTHSFNADWPIEYTLLNEKDVIDEHPSNADSSICVRVSGQLNALRDVHPLNAYPEIRVTVCGIWI